MDHQLRTWPRFFQRVQSGEKTFEVRKNDRDFQVGDTLFLNEYDPEQDLVTGYIVHAKVTYIIHGGQFGIEPGYCVMAIEKAY